MLPFSNETFNTVYGTDSAQRNKLHNRQFKHANVTPVHTM